MIRLKDEMIICGKGLREFSPTPLNPELSSWFETAKKVMELPAATCHFISNKEIKKHCEAQLHWVGFIGKAYVEDNSIAFIESDFGILVDKETIIHELLHLKEGWEHGKKFDEEVTRYCSIITKQEGDKE